MKSYTALHKVDLEALGLYSKFKQESPIKLIKDEVKRDLLEYMMGDSAVDWEIRSNDYELKATAKVTTFNQDEVKQLEYIVSSLMKIDNGQANCLGVLLKDILTEK